MMTPRQRFMRNVRIHPNGCWIWCASRDSQGYGFFFGFGEKKAHRASYVMHKGKIPPGMSICHSCPGGDDPSCVNPQHLSVGTPARNQAQKAARGRALGRNLGKSNGVHTRPETRATGERNGASKLTPSIVREIRQRSASGETVLQLALHFGVSRPAIYNVVHHKTWKTVQ